MSSLLRSMATKRVLSIVKQSKRMGSHHAPYQPPFARLRPPTGLLPRDVELIWDDSVSPETCVDFDAPHVGTAQVVKSFLLAMGFFVALYQLVKLSDPVGSNPVAVRGTVLSKEEWLYNIGLGPKEDVEEH